MNIKCIGRNDKTNFKAGFLWSEEIPQVFSNKLSKYAKGFVNNTGADEYCMFIDNIRYNGDIGGALLVKIKEVSSNSDGRGIGVNIVTENVFSNVNINQKDFLPKIIDRFKGMLTAKKAMKRTSRFPQDPIQN